MHPANAIIRQVKTMAQHTDILDQVNTKLDLIIEHLGISEANVIFEGADRSKPKAEPKSEPKSEPKPAPAPVAEADDDDDDSPAVAPKRPGRKPKHPAH